MLQRDGSTQANLKVAEPVSLKNAKSAMLRVNAVKARGRMAAIGTGPRDSRGDGIRRARVNSCDSTFIEYCLLRGQQAQ